jgi:hypothetical protein
LARNYYYRKFKHYRSDNRKFDQNKGKHGYVYLLENRPNDFAYKIGHTTRIDVNDRVREINKKYDGHYAYKPANYFCIHKVKTIDCYTAEQLVHKELDSFRVMPKFELFEFKNDSELAFAKSVIHRICMQINGEFSESVIIVPPYVEPVEEQEPKVFEGLTVGKRKAEPVVDVPPLAEISPLSEAINEIIINDRITSNKQTPKHSRIAIAWGKFKAVIRFAVRTVVYVSLAIIILWSVIKPEDKKVTKQLSVAPVPTKPAVIKEISTYDADYEKQLIKNEEKMLSDYQVKEVEKHKKIIKKKVIKKEVITQSKKITMPKLSEFEMLKLKTQESIKNRNTSTSIDAYKEKVKSNLDEIKPKKYCFNLENGELKCY